MTRYTLLTLALVSLTVAQDEGFTPLVDKKFKYPDEIPFKVDTDVGKRGGQFGYNLCNSTTEGESSLCQTSMLNDLTDFCLWGPPEKDSAIGDTEGETVAWCTKPGRGTRLIPAGALQGVQFIRTPDYVQVTGHIDQEKINIIKGDTGGEMDPHGADFRGNPLGGLLYSNSWGGNNESYTQVIEWHNFIGSDFFCLKACDPAGPNAAQFCQHIYDRIGCLYNAPTKVDKGTFESCDGDNQDYPGIYTDEAGAVQTYTQPPESLGAIQTMPYQPKVPASSNCVPFESAKIYAAASEPTASGSHSGTATRTRTGANASQTAGGDNGAGSLTVPAVFIAASFALSFLY